MLAFNSLSVQTNLMSETSGAESISIPDPQVSGRLDFYIPVSRTRRELVNKFNEMMGLAVELSGVLVLEDTLDDKQSKYQTRRIRCGSLLGDLLSPELRTSYDDRAEKVSIDLNTVSAGDWPSSLIHYSLGQIADEDWWSNADSFLRADISAPRDQLLGTISHHLSEATAQPVQFLRNWATALQTR